MKLNELFSILLTTPKTTDNVNVNMPTSQGAGTIDYKSDLKDYRNQISVAVEALRKIRDIYGAHHTIRMGEIKTTLEKWLDNVLQNLSRIRKGLPGPLANDNKAAKFRNVQAKKAQSPDVTGEPEPAKRFRGKPGDAEHFRVIGATNQSNQWNPDFGK